MKKLSLHPDELRVETFDPTAAPAEPRGTVQGAGGTVGYCCTASCGGTCGAQPASDWRIANYGKTLTYCPECCV
jgi:hypothetical protein